jgi:hypothetical protein
MFLRQKHAQVVELDVKCLNGLMTICRGYHGHSPFCHLVTRDAATHPKGGSAVRRMAILATSHDVHSSRSSTDLRELGEKRHECTLQQITLNAPTGVSAQYPIDTFERSECGLPGRWYRLPRDSWSPVCRKECHRGPVDLCHNQALDLLACFF